MTLFLEQPDPCEQPRCTRHECLAFVPSNETLVAIGHGGKVLYWPFDAAASQNREPQSRELKTTAGRLRHCAVTQDGRWLAQTWASVEHGMWNARSAEFLQTPILETFRWLRAIGDTIFAVGIVAIGWFVVGLSTGWSRKGERTEADATGAAYESE